MKVYVNREPVTGPWGGGNKTLTAVIDNLKGNGHEVVFALCEDIDVIFCIDPRPNNRGEWYQHYLNYKNQLGAKIVQRVGDVGTHGKPELTELVKQSVQFSDSVIFLSKWAKNYIGYEGENCLIVENSPLSEFYKSRKNDVILPEKVDIITHHWSTNPKKGFEYYKHLDDHITNNESRYNFTYAGRLPDGFKFDSVNYVDPIGDNSLLSKLISENNIYLTASEEEAGANHVLEALACGLPIVYHNKGGSIVDYCEDYGVEYDSFESMFNALDQVVENYEDYKTKVLGFNRTMDDSIKEYVRIIENV